MDAPVLSNPAEVVERRITLMAGGRREDFDRAKALLDAVADNVVYTGGTGDSFRVQTDKQHDLYGHDAGYGRNPHSGP